ncbi:hypothetical protein FNF31_05177 [Cafeteria roenbergensis]|uniref:Tyrosine-protein kinase ephrin type A/B receptor-like domain-containing protein n=1 Tax=Cafeteria roenbergensis TaxID=33653 RepID=A0A5A8D273_CAFRO|nr:hypothetical protein FNF31_05177 [Cafeteria roenbergensis]
MHDVVQGWASVESFGTTRRGAIDQNGNLWTWDSSAATTQRSKYSFVSQVARVWGDASGVEMILLQDGTLKVSDEVPTKLIGQVVVDAAMVSGLWVALKADRLFEVAEEAVGLGSRIRSLSLAVHAHGNHLCSIVAADRSLNCIFSDASGYGTNSASMPSPNTGWAHVRVRGSGKCAIRETGPISCVGMSASVQAAVPTTGSFSALALVDDAACAIANDTSLVCWGDGPAATLPPELANRTGWTDIAAQADEICGIRQGRLACWGSATSADGLAALPVANGWSDVVLVDPSEATWPSDPVGCAGRGRCRNLTAALSSGAGELAVVLAGGSEHLLERLECQAGWLGSGAVHRAVVAVAGGAPAVVRVGEGASLAACPPKQAGKPTVMAVQLVTSGPVSFERADSPGAPATLPLWPEGSEAGWQATSSLHLDHAGIGSVALGTAHVEELVIRADAGPASTAPLRSSLAGVRATKVRVSLGNGSAPGVLTAIADQVAGLQELTLHDCPSAPSVDAGAVGGSSTLRVVDLWRCRVERLRPELLSGARSLQAVALPAELTSVAPGSFNGSSLKTIDLRASAGLVELGTGAIAGAANLSSLLLPSGLRRINASALSGALSLTELDLRDTQVARLQNRSLDGTPALSSLKLGSNVEAIDPGALAGTEALAVLDLSATSVTELPPALCLGASGLISLVLPARLDVVHEGALAQCRRVNSLDLSGTLVQELPASMLEGMANLSRLVVPVGLREVGPRALSGAPRLESIDLSRTAVTSLQPLAISELPLLDSLQLPFGITALPAGSFLNLPRLSHLDLAVTKLEVLEAGALAELGGMLHLRLGSPWLRSVGEGCHAFEGLVRLRSLTVEPSPQLAGLGAPRSLPPGGIASCSFAGSLQSLSISGVNLSSLVLERDTLGAAGGTLKAVSIRGSGLWDVRTGALTSMRLLQSLDLSMNRIVVLPRLSRAVLEAIGSINATGNALDEVAADVFAGLLNLRTVEAEVGKECNPGTVRQAVQLKGDAVAMCVKCVPGKYCPDGATAEPCPIGTYGTEAGLASSEGCTTCPAGSTTLAVGESAAEACVPVVANCAAGTGGSLCRPCSAGTASTGGREAECELCSPGFVSASMLGSIDCEPCPAGTFQPASGAATEASCLPCGLGLVSAEGSRTCRACPAGTELQGTACVACSGPDALLRCPAGAAQAVELPQTLEQLLGKLPTGAAPAVPAVDPGAALDAGSSQEDASARRARAAGRSLQSGDAPAGAAAPDDEQLSNVELLAWTLQVSLGISAGAVLVVLGLMLVFPCARTFMWPVLAAVDGFRVAHAQPRFAAVRVVPTVTGGVFTLAAAVAALALASALVVGYFGANTLRSSSLKVEATGVENAHLAASATGDILFDAVFQPMRSVACASAAELVVDSPSGDVSQLAATASTSVLQQSGTGPVCWTRGKCTGCQFRSAAEVALRTHWSVQSVAWRLASTDAEGMWVSVNGLVSPATASGASVLGNGSRMLERHSETLALVPHVAIDDTPTGGMLGGKAGSSGSVDASGSSKGRVSTGLIPQDLSREATSRTNEADVNPALARAELRLVVERSAVFSDLRISQISSETQLISAIAGIVVGVLGAFASGFRTFEAHCGERLVWMCGPTGRIATEADALGRARGKPLEPLMETGKPSIPKAAASASRLHLLRVSSPNPLVSRTAAGAHPERAQPQSQAGGKPTS